MDASLILYQKKRRWGFPSFKRGMQGGACVGDGWVREISLKEEKI